MAEADPANPSLLRRLRGKAEVLQAGVAETIGALPGAGGDEIKERISELNEIIPFLCELGYSVEDIHIGIGLIPDVGLAISGLTKTLPEATYDRIIQEQGDKGLLISVIKGLQTASILQRKIHIMGMRADTARLTLGLPPKITLEFKKET